MSRRVLEGGEFAVPNDAVITAAETNICGTVEVLEIIIITIEGREARAQYE